MLNAPQNFLHKESSCEGHVHVTRDRPITWACVFSEIMHSLTAHVDARRTLFFSGEKDVQSALLVTEFSRASRPCERPCIHKQVYDYIGAD